MHLLWWEPVSSWWAGTATPGLSLLQNTGKQMSSGDPLQRTTIFPHALFYQSITNEKLQKHAFKFVELISLKASKLRLSDPAGQPATGV